MSVFSKWFKDARAKLPDNVSVGRHTYGVTWRKVLFPTNEAPLNVGSFCSVAGQVLFMCTGQHQTKSATSFPIYSRVLKQPEPLPNAGKPGGITIGNDVWIGHGAIILPGVTVGDGAVVGAGSVVTKSVEPYAIVAGNRAQVIRSRFPADTVAQLLEIQWWLWDEDKIKSEAATLSGPIEVFIAKHATRIKSVSTPKL
ncbi:chloramphenicol acetyltransferase [Mesorhizobium sp. LSJC268A00]|uniref:CatB-related O-acetyltransferase n=1 Tax=unclassified Mesorhizobium TaxID=325217 RepID=UPI0003CE21BB|nr:MULTISPECIES: CatB-related O-acetyltransferase [unclassified Mesorhizobium]ESX06794.1 chloramphenicol acetyltransferase [Mesorhizobium sp. LSJC268A00]ESX13502.1 chloramphenicol acetyltransferase [Mesorhizobium sp. LSJC265A00]ESX31940.1 chloramphenicol acetyltransferase [Mesorhizobium sp. LSHC440B00]ESX39344.1 chloramphenicol acetyltransferase [Mesorhizobium sp. LSHC432A00]ESX44288.1 chloramphenicol acetyltransferase [Mesorhizobium sp. LSHC440A00]